MKKKLCVSILAIIMCLSMFSRFASAEHATPTGRTEINGEVPVVNFPEGEDNAVYSKNELKYFAKDIEVFYKYNEFYVNLILSNNKVEKELCIQAMPIESIFNTGGGNTVIGRQTKITEGFELANLRIEEAASNLTLMPINLDLEGKVVISLGIRDILDGEIFYFQSELKNFNFSGLMDSAANNSSELSEEDILDLEEDYLFMTSDRSLESEEVIILFDESVVMNPEQERQGEEMLAFLERLEEKGEIVSPNITPFGVVHTNVPDDIFKSGPFDTWQHKNSSTFCYSYITYRFAGTDNRDSYIAYMEYVNQSTGSPHNITLRVKKNMNVLYNIYDGKIVGTSNANRVHINNVRLSLKSNTKNGVFTSRKYWGVSSKSTLQKVLEASVGWVKYLGTIVDSYEKLIGADLNANKKYTYQPTATGQYAEYGRVIGEITATTSKIRYPEDYFSLEGYGNGINSCTPTYRYTAQFK